VRLKQRHEALTLNARRWLDPAQIEQRRHHIDRFNNVVNGSSRRNSRRPVHDQWRLGQLTVHRLTMKHTSMIEKLFTVIAQKHEERSILDSEVTQSLDQSGNLHIHASNRSVVPVLVVFYERVRIKTSLLQFLTVWHAEGSP